MPFPSSFSDEIFDRICVRLAEGETLRQICRSPGMPSRNAVMRWVKDSEYLRERYDRARQDGMDALADTIIDIAWDSSNDTTIDQKGRVACNHEWIARSRLKIDTVKFLMTKINPWRYGDRLPELIATQQLEAKVVQHEPIATITRVIVDPKPRDDGDVLLERVHTEELVQSVAPPPGVLAAKVIANLDRRAATTPDAKRKLAEWLAAFQLVAVGASYDEAIATISPMLDHKLIDLAEALQIA